MGLWVGRSRHEDSTMMPLCESLGASRVAIFLAFVIFCTAVSASAQLYEWTDEQGRKNFTDNPNRVPEKYRANATQLPGVQATPDAIRRDAERRRREELESAARTRQRELEDAKRSLQREVNQAAEACAQDSGVQIIVKPGGSVKSLGTLQERFDFEKCMVTRGQSTGSAR